MIKNKDHIIIIALAFLLCAISNFFILIKKGINDKEKILYSEVQEKQKKLNLKYENIWLVVKRKAALSSINKEEFDSVYIDFSNDNYSKKIEVKNFYLNHDLFNFLKFRSPKYNFDLYQNITMFLIMGDIELKQEKNDLRKAKKRYIDYLNEPVVKFFLNKN